MLSIEDEKRDAALDFFNYTGLKIDHSDDANRFVHCPKKINQKTKTKKHPSTKNPQKIDLRRLKYQS